MGDSISSYYDDLAEKEWREKRQKADKMREKIVSEWEDWSLEKMQMIEIIGTIHSANDEPELKFMKNRDRIKEFFRTVRMIGDGDI